MGNSGVPRGHQAEGADDVIDPFARHQASQLQNRKFMLRPAQSPARLVALHRGEFVGVEPQGMISMRAGSASTVRSGRLRLAGIRRSRNRIPAPGHLRWRSARRESRRRHPDSGGAPGPGVKCRHQRYAERGLDAQCRRPRHEKIGVHDVVPHRLTPKKIDQEITECRHVGQQFFLGKMTGGTGRDMHHAHIPAEWNDRRKCGVILPCKHIDMKSPVRELPSDVRHVNILAAGIDSSGITATAGMHARRSTLLFP